MVLISKVYNFDRAVHTGPPGYRYADRPLPGGSVKNRPAAVDFGRRRLILKEIDRRWSIEEEKGKKRKRKKEGGNKEYLASAVLARLPSPPAGRLRAIAARGSPARRRRPRLLFLPREETYRGDRYALCIPPDTGPVPVPIICWYTGTDR
ncbi:hypothetical protein BHE74_00032018 [Ensete ventricosum]|nr:hypothetical protein BHE74_00032018 [Ensete ventricosum]